MRQVVRGAVGLTAIAVGVMGAAAQAADLPVKAPVAVPAFNWSGCYIGGNSGVASAHASFTTSIDTGNVFGQLNRQIIGAAGTGSNRNESFVGGGQIGCNLQIRRYVWGIEADAQWLSAKPRIAVTGALFTGDPFTITNSVKNDWLATVRARAGIVSDRSMIYVTGGVAFSDMGYTQAFSSPVIGPVSGGFGVSKTRTGWTVGGGWEYIITNSWSVKAEYLHVRFSSFDAVGVLVPLAGATQVIRGSVRESIDIGRVGLNYRIGG